MVATTPPADAVTVSPPPPDADALDVEALAFEPVGELAAVPEGRLALVE